MEGKTVRLGSGRGIRWLWTPVLLSAGYDIVMWTPVVFGGDGVMWGVLLFYPPYLIATIGLVGYLLRVRPPGAFGWAVLLAVFACCRAQRYGLETHILQRILDTESNGCRRYTQRAHSGFLQKLLVWVVRQLIAHNRLMVSLLI